MPHSKNLISVVVPVYNGVSKFLSQTLNFLENQDYSPMEYIFVDDGSEDDSLRLLEDFASKSKHMVKIISQENSGVCVARNKGFHASRGEYIAFCDQDDIFSPAWSRSLVEAIDKHQADMAFCGHDFADSSGKVFRCYTDKFCYPNEDYAKGEDILVDYMFGKTPLWGGSVLYRRSFLEENNISYTPGCLCAEDNEVFVKSLAMARKVAIVKESLAIWRRHQFATSFSNEGYKLYSNLHELASYLRCLAFMKRKGKQNTMAFQVLSNLILPSAYVNYVEKILIGNGIKEFERVIRNRAFKERIKKNFKWLFLKKRPDLFFKLCLAVFSPGVYASITLARKQSKEKKKEG
jgi:glycosyltransferase involved in cell wall biosynthesis